MTSSGDRAAKAAVMDLLEVTRRVTLPVAENGTHWCATVTPTQMVDYVLQELVEVESEIKQAIATIETADGFFPQTAQKKKASAFGKVKDELGDLLFDVLMLGYICERQFGPEALADASVKFVDVNLNKGVTIAGAALNASEKVKRRSPYTFDIGVPAPSLEEEKQEWKRIKKIEKKAKESGDYESLPNAGPTFRGSIFSKYADEFYFFLPGVCLGVCAGVTAGALLWRKA